MPYGLLLERQPNNPHDANAIALYGVAEVRGLFGTKRREWHIGFVPAAVSADVVPNLIDKGIPVAVELYRIYEGQQGFIDVKFFVLAPPGHSHSRRTRRDR
ncbi:MAG: HIRAN domain-containing protein [Devosia sp.]